MARNIYASFICLLLNFFISDGYAQNRYTLPQLTPHSPNAASLGKYGDIPVSLNNGMANISIPLFNVKIGSFDLPVTLSYHNNGLKTNEIPSWAGLGWDISSFGAINIQTRGNGDFADEGNGMFSTIIPSQQKLQSYLQNQMTAQEKYDYLEGVLRGDYDSEYDLYTYSFLGQSGSFFLDANQHVICVPQSNLKITKDPDGFTIVDERGNKYYFYLAEHTESTPFPENDLYARKSFNGTGSYLLSRIITADNRTVDFGYSPYPFNYHTTSEYAKAYDRPKYVDECPNQSYVTTQTNVFVKNYLLTNIYFDGGSVRFILSSNSREDIKNIAVPDQAGATFFPYLDRVQLLDDKGTIINDFALSHSYFNNTARLRLDGVTKMAANNTAENWQFKYFDNNGTYTSVPKINEGTKDHWGYVNGNTTTTNMPACDYRLFVSGWSSPFPYMTNRNSKFNMAENGLLQSITYPTGGKSLFTYEPNQIKYNYYHEMVANPFLGYDIDISSIPATTLVAETTDAQSTVTGSFTFDNPALITVIASKENNPSNFVNSYVGISTTPDGADLITTKLGFTCLSGTCMAQGKIQLAPGTYYYKLVRNQDEFYPEDRGHAGLTVTMIPDHLPYPFPYVVGGCRIASIENINNAGVSSKKRYEYSDLNGSLNFRNVPDYISRMDLHMNTINKTGTGSAITFCVPCQQEKKIHDESVVPFTGNPVEYADVTEYNDDAGANGKTEYHFSYTENLSRWLNSPYLSPFMATWSGGQLLNKKIYKSVPGGTGYSYDKVEEDDFVFASTDPSSIIYGFKTEYLTYCDYDNLYYREYSISKENYQTERFSQIRSTKTQFDKSGNIIQASGNTYSSAAHTLPTEVTGTNSREEDVRQLASYSFEYTAGAYTDGPSLGIKALLDKNILAPVENLVVKKINGVDYVVSGKLMTYKNNSATLDKVYELAIKAPVLLTSLTRSFINSSGQFVKDSHYEERATISLYDNYNNVLQQQYANDLIQSFIYGYNSMYLVAAATNADAASIAYTSFESEDGNWTVSGSARENISFTGHQSYQLQNGKITKTGLSANRKYLVTYWTMNSVPFSISGTLNTPKLLKETRGWKCFEHSISGVTDIEIPQTNGLIDELRFCPAEATMITYTYDPLIGLTTQNDVANNVTYYEYDAFRRLWLVRDLDKNILKQFEYQYQSNQSDGANWVKSGNTRCKPCPSNNNYTINVHQYEERDNNPNSLSYLSTRWIDDGEGSCSIAADWQNTTTAARCKQVSNLVTGEQEQEQSDRNPCSGTYNQTRWITTGINCTACVPAANWVATGNTRCLLDQNNNLTGYLEREEVNQIQNCGGQTRWVNIGFHPETCLPPCYYCQNPGEGVKCVNGGCESGIKVYTNSYQQGNWIYCVYHYEFSDGTWSGDYSEQSDNWCIL